MAELIPMEFRTSQTCTKVCVHSYGDSPWLQRSWWNSTALQFIFLGPVMNQNTSRERLQNTYQLELTLLVKWNFFTTLIIPKITSVHNAGTSNFWHGRVIRFWRTDKKPTKITERIQCKLQTSWAKGGKTKLCSYQDWFFRSGYCSNAWFATENPK